MKEFKYTIDGKVYNVEIDNVDEEKSMAQVKVNGESFEVGMEKPAEPEKKKVELGKPVAADAADEPSSAPVGNTANAIKAPLRVRSQLSTSKLVTRSKPVMPCWCSKP